jgi:nucleotide-binding universal stress UspA family protein
VRASRLHAPAPHAGARLVVAATDFTPVAAAAARRAAELARASGSRLLLFHAGAEQARERLRLSAARLGAAFGLPVEMSLASGPAAPAIAAYARRTRANLVVVGNPEGGLLSDLLALNTADRVRRRAALPVLAVARARREPYARVLLATDLSPRGAEAVRLAQRLFPGAQLHLLHASEPLYEGSLHFAGVGGDLIAAYRRRALLLAERQLDAFVADALPGVEATTQVRLGPAAACIREHALAIGADVVVMSPGGSRLARATGRSVSEQVLAYAPCDVLLANS